MPDSCPSYSKVERELRVASDFAANSCSGCSVCRTRHPPTERELAAARRASVRLPARRSRPRVCEETIVVDEVRTLTVPQVRRLAIDPICPPFSLTFLIFLLFSLLSIPTFLRFPATLRGEEFPAAAGWSPTHQEVSESLPASDCSRSLHHALTRAKS